MEMFGDMLSAFGDAIAERVVERIMPLIQERETSGKENNHKVDFSLGDNEVRGNKGLAEKLKVSVGTVQRWKRDGILDPAVVCDYGRVIIYNINKAKACIKYMPLKAGRPKKR